MDGSEVKHSAVETAPAVGPHAAGIRWDLGRIFPSIEDARAALERILDDAAAFEREFRGKVAGLEGQGLRDALDRLGSIRNEYARIDQYGDLRFSIDSREAATKDLMDVTSRAREDIQNRTRFFDLEWQAIPADIARSRATAPAVAPYEHVLERLTAYAPHMRSESEESMLAARETAAVSEWQKLFGENVDKIEVEFDAGKGPESHTLDRLLAYSRHPERTVRFAAYELAYRELEPRIDVQAACYNAIVGDRLGMDRVRGFKHPMQATNLANDLPDAVVDALVDSVKSYYRLAHRWFGIKAGLLGLPKLHLFDQYAPLGVPKEVTFEQAWDSFVSGTRRFSEHVDGLLQPFLLEGRIDAEPRSGKRGGAFCAPVCWGAEPYMLMNFTDDARSIETLAHEAGHGLHFILAGQTQPPLAAGMGLAMAEVASTFQELVQVDYMMENEPDSQQRRLLTAGQIEGAFAVIFRQTMMTGYERKAYGMKADGKALTADRLCDIWITENREYYGDAVEIPDDYRMGWAYIPHFIDTRFYTYAYSFAHLASMALYSRYRQEGSSFIPKYLDLLAAGGSRTPNDLLALGGIDVSDPDWVEPSFEELERMIDRAESAG